MDIKKPQKSSYARGVRLYLSYYRGRSKELLWALYLHTVEMAPHMIFPLIIKVILDYFIPVEDIPGLLVCLIAAAILLSVTAYFYPVYRVSFIRVLKDVSRDLRNAIIRRLQLLSLSFHNQSSTGRLYSKIISDVERLENFVNMLVQQVFFAVAYLIFTIGVLIFINWKILALFLLCIPLFLVVLEIFKGRMRKSRHGERIAREDLSHTVSIFLQAALLSRMHGHEDYETARVNQSSLEVTEKSMYAEAHAALFSVVNTFGSIFFHFLVTVVAAMYVIHGTLTLGEMVLFSSYIGQIINRFIMLLNLLPQFAEFNESLLSIQEILEAPDIEYNVGKKHLDRIRGEITFDHVTFAYPDAPRPALIDVTVQIAPGMTVGVVGTSGSGKSTLVSLVLGLYRTRDGVVAIDGHPINDLDMQAVRQHFGVVSQAPIIFNGTVYENIVHAYKNVPMERVIEAAKNANAHEFIMQLKDDYQSIVGQSGAMLSGGQKQRIAIARTFLRAPAILILDEATSALDSIAEKQVQEAIDRLARNMTTLIIAHRLSTVKNVDLLLVMKDGRIVETGKHEELLRQQGEYARLVEHQMFVE